MLDLSSCSVPLTPEHTFICIRHCVGQCISKCPGPVRLQTKIWSAPHLWKWTLITLYGSNFQAYTCSRNLFQGGYWLSYSVNDKCTVCCGFFLMHYILSGFFCSIFHFPHKPLTYISCCLLLSDSVLMQCGGHAEDYASQKSFRYADYHIFISIRLQMCYMETSWNWEFSCSFSFMPYA